MGFEELKENEEFENSEKDDFVDENINPAQLAQLTDLTHKDIIFEADENVNAKDNALENDEQNLQENEENEENEADLIDENIADDDENNDEKDKLINFLQRQIDCNEILNGDLGFAFKPLEEKAKGVFSFLDVNGQGACAKSVYYALALENFDEILSQIEKREYEKALKDFCEIEKSSNQSLYSEAKNKKTIASMNDKEFEMFCQKAIAGEYSSLK